TISDRDWSSDVCSSDLANNVYDVTVQVSDGSLIDTQTIAVAVTNVNEPPVITSNAGGDTASISIPENSLSVTDVNATDPDGLARSEERRVGKEGRKQRQ